MTKKIEVTTSIGNMVSSKESDDVKVKLILQALYRILKRYGFDPYDNKNKASEATNDFNYSLLFPEVDEEEAERVVSELKKAISWDREGCVSVSKLDAYTQHHPVRRKFNRRRIIALKIDNMWQMDLADFSKYKRFNGGYHYILVAIDFLFHFLRTLPLKMKCPAEMIGAMIRLFRRGNVLTRIFCDRGGEFYNKTVKKYLSRKKVHIYSIFSPVIKASQAERVIRTLRDRIFRYFRVTGKYHFICALPKIVRDINNTKHRTLGISPSEITPKNKLALFNKINGKPVVLSVKKKLKVRDKVRALLHKKGFQKSSEGSWSPQIFTVSCMRDTSPPVVQLEDYWGKEVDGSFYPKEVPRRKFELGSQLFFGSAIAGSSNPTKGYKQANLCPNRPL
ncbi:uncharacterized protein LOC135393906 [Ornithodoros turicata]|uniref:uncharacterized protein LOC135393906 n=1 Tax=Ornithodoros turicata TaxID=34597 RepID=UPI003138F1E8